MNKELIHHIIEKTGPKSSKDMICAIAYFSDFNFYEIYEKSLTGSQYIHGKNGPIPENFSESIESLIED